MNPTSLAKVFALIRFVSRRRAVSIDHPVGRVRKVNLSAGAIHPIDILILSGPDISVPVVYSDVDDVFGTVEMTSKENNDEAISSLIDILPMAQGHLILFAGDLSRIGQAYDNAESLLWRDAGAMLQSFAYAATAYNLAFSPIGALGTDALRNICTPNSSYVALGTALIGAPQSD